MHELVDTNNVLPSQEYDTLAAALSVTRTETWAKALWKIYDPQGVVVRDWTSNP